MKTVFITYLTLFMSLGLVVAHPLSEQRHSASGESFDLPYVAQSSADAPMVAQVDTDAKFKYGDIVLSYGNGLGGFGYGPGAGFGYGPSAGLGMGMPAYGGGFGTGMTTGGGYIPPPYYPNSWPGRYDNLGMGNFYGRRYN